MPVRRYRTAAMLAAASMLVAAPASAQQEVSLSYQGRLDLSGAPFDGIVPITVQLFSEQVDGIAITSPFTIKEAEVDNGLFHIEIPYEPDRFNLNRDVWIEISIDGSTLRPRQRYIPAAKAAQAGTAERSNDGSVVFSRDTISSIAALNFLSGSATATVQSAWQSFRPEITGNLDRLVMLGDLVLGDTITYNLYEGLGTGGSLLATFDTFQSANAIEAIVDIPFLLQANDTYTFEVIFTDSNTQLPGSGEILITPNTYPRGRASTSIVEDFVFAVEVERPGGSTVRVTPDAGVEIGGQLRVDGVFGSAGDDVLLPESSIESDETLDEPGIATSTVDEGKLSSTTYSVLDTLSITVPAPGYVVAQMTAELQFLHVNGVASSYTIGFSNVPDTLVTTQDFQRSIPAAAATGLYEEPYNVHAVFSVASPGQYTFYVIGRKDLSGSPIADLVDDIVTLMYFPTSYGSVSASGNGILNTASSATPGQNNAQNTIQNTVVSPTLVSPPSYPPALESERIMREYHEALTRPASDD